MKAAKVKHTSKINIEIANQQKIKAINKKELKKELKKILTILKFPSYYASFVLSDNKTIKKLNRKFFKKDCPTDVIAFPLRDDFDDKYLGEVVVSVEMAIKIAKKLKLRWQDELRLYLIHGILHLIGYSDKTKALAQKMQKKQEEVLQLLNKK